MAYRVQVDTDDLFTGTLAFEDEVGRDVLSTPTTDLPDGEYFWRVGAQDASGRWGNWSAAERFVIETDH